MIGLNTSIFKSAGRKLVNLLGALKDRATYYENGTDSVAEKNRIDDLGVLDKATILLTPTATSDARVHSVKTYTGENFLTGNNSTFDSGVGDWEIYNGASIAHSTDKLEVTLTTGESGARVAVNSLVPGGQVGKTFKIRARIWQGTWSETFLRVFLGSVQKSIYISSTPTYYEVTIKPTDASHLYIYRSGSGSAGTFFIDDVSIVDVSSDFDFDRASSATRINSSGLVQDMQSITDPELVLNGDFEELGDNYIINPTFDTSIPFGTSGSGWVTIDSSSDNGTIEFFNGGIRMQRIGSNLKRLRAVLSGGSQAVIPSTVETYKIQYEVISATDDNSLSSIYLGGASVQVGSSNTTVGVHTIYGESGGSNGIIQFQPLNNKEVVLDNISVQQVDPNDRWTLGTGWSIEDGKLVGDGAMTPSDVVIQSYNFEDGGTYKITFEITESSRGSVFIREPFNAGNKATGEVGIHTIYGVAGAANELRLRSDDTFVGKIDNVSIKHVSFEEDNVDLARINYDSNGDNGHILLEPTSTNLIKYSEDFSSGSGGWSAIDGASVDPNYAISPRGTQDAWKFNYDGTTNGRVETLVQSGITAQQPITFSVWLKTLSGTKEVIIGHSAWGLQLLTVTNEWQRFTYTVTATTNFGYPRVRMDSEGSILVWGYQLEQLPYATSYIPNHGASAGVTRATETLTGSGNSTLINSTEGVLYAEIAGLVDDDSTSNSYHRIISISDNSTTNRVELKALNDGTLEFRFDSSSSDIRLYHTSFDFTIFNKIALVWESGRCAAYLNGVKVVEDFTFSTFGSNVLHELSFDSPYDGGSNLFYGKCKALAVFNEALEDDELELLTGVTNYGSFSELASANGYTII